MKRVLLVCLGLIMVGSYAGCLPDDATPTGTGGSQGSAGSGAAGTGSPGSGGSGVAGTMGQGGDSQGQAGNGQAGSDPAGQAGNGQAGSSQAGNGQAGNGQAGTTGGSNAGTGGSSRGGSGGAAAGTTGGTTPRGGSGGSTAGTGGTGTAGTTGGLPAIGELFPVTSTTVGSFDGRLMVMPCGDDNASGTDCGGGGGYYSTAGATTATYIACSGGSFTGQQVFNVGGETGKIYDVTIHIYGVSEPKNYGTNGQNGLMREAGTGRPALTPTGAGATPTGWATAPGGHTYPVSDYNTGEIRVCSTRACATADETNVYYLNSDTREGHWTYVLNYEKHISVVGGGSIRVKNYDRNCREIKNCGPEGEPATACANDANARIINISAASPQPSNATAASGGLLQPNLNSARPVGSSGQWLLIDVVKINSVM